MAVNFVKFERGLKSVYTAKKDANRLDSNTLYFVYETANATQGELYLGSKLIGGTSAASAQSLGDLLDVNLSGVNLAEGMILHYDSLNGEWVPVSIISAMEAAKQAGANLGGADVTVGAKNSGETAAQALSRLVSSPTEGDIAIIDGAPYVYSGLEWVPLDSPGLNTRVETLETDVSGLQIGMAAVDGKIASAIAAANHLTYRVLTSDEALTPSIVPSDQLNKTVFLVPKTGSVGDSYDEYMYVQNSGFEKLGSWTADLSNYVTSSQFNTQVTSLDNRITALEGATANYVLTSRFNSEVGSITNLRAYDNNNGPQTVVDGLLELYDRLTWIELSNS